MPPDGTGAAQGSAPGSAPAGATTATSVPAAAPATTTSATPAPRPAPAAVPAAPVHIQLATVTIETTIPVSTPFPFGLTAVAIVLLLGAAAYAWRAWKGGAVASTGSSRCDSLRTLLEEKKRQLEEHVREWPEEKLKEVAFNRTAAALKQNETLAPAVAAALEAKEAYEKLQKAVQLLETRLTLCELSLPPTPNPDVVVRDSSIEGKGVFALRAFKTGERVLEWGKRKELAKEEYDSLSEDMRRRYVSTDGGKRLLSGEPMRYVNHSCNPNTNPKEGADVAIRDIAPGEEITSDYRDFGVEGIACNCGARACKGAM